MDIKQIKENKIRMIHQFSIPSIIAMLLQTVITITDGYFTGNYVGQNALTAINLGLSILYFYFGTGLCIGVGGSVIPSQCKYTLKPIKFYGKIKPILLKK